MCGITGAVSFTDNNIGKLLAEVDALQLTETTVVAIMGDHVRHRVQPQPFFCLASLARTD